jgi:hypothetical protein
VAYTYKDPTYLQTAAADQTALPVHSSSSSSSEDSLQEEPHSSTAGTEVGSAAAVAAVQRQLAAWSGGYNGYSWQLHLRQFAKVPSGFNQTVNVFVFIKGVPDAEPVRSSSSSSSSSSSRVSPNTLRLRKDYCGSANTWNDAAAMLAGKKFSQAIDLTNCMRAAGISPDEPPADASNPAKGPARAPIRVDDLWFLVLSASGEDVTASYELGKPVIGWALAVHGAKQQQQQQQELATVQFGAMDGAAALEVGLYSLLQGQFEEAT